MIHAKNYEKLSKFVKVTAKILSGHGVEAEAVKEKAVITETVVLIIQRGR